MAWTILRVILFLILAPFAGGLLSGLDRKVTARFQGRQGPPVLQPFYDLFKLFHKQTFVVNKVQDFFVIGYFVFSLFAGGLFFAGGDLLLAFFALTLSEIFLFMAASSANSPYSSMGSQRELLQIMSYEPMLLLTAIGFYMMSGSFMVSNVVRAKFSPIAVLPGIFLGFVFMLIIKFRKSPFDISTSHHAHQEMVKGLTTELTGNMYAFVELGTWYEDIMFVCYISLFVVNTNLWSIPIAVLTSALVYFFVILVDNVFPRVKWDKMLSSAWVVTLVFGGVNLLVLSLLH